jgi:antitoxin component YwqK of YwqJK toxin-antitoxin module
MRLRKKLIEFQTTRTVYTIRKPAGLKGNFLLLCLLLPVLTTGQQRSVSMEDATGRLEVSMADVTGKSDKGTYRYYAKGESVPFTGILYSKFPNGQFDSWQEYVDGVGQGSWINYYENGNYREVGTYEQNRVEGPVKKYYPDGTLKADGTYRDWRIKIGVWRYYDTHGTLVGTTDYGLKGSLEDVEEFYERGEISRARYDQIRSKNGF